MLIKSLAVSQVGKVREHNEDAVLSDDDSGLWIVADGMGGHACGEVASQLAIDVIAEKVADKNTLADAVALAHQAILKQAEEQPEQNGMGTTLVAARKVNAGFNIAWVGDSRAYLFDNSKDENKNNLKKLTTDHSFVQDLILRGILTEDEAIGHPQGNLINRSLGMTGSGFGVDDISFYPKQKGILFLCSDGVTDYISFERLQHQFETHDSLQDISEGISAAVLDSEAADNFTFILISFEINGLTKLRNRFRKNTNQKIKV